MKNVIIILIAILTTMTQSTNAQTTNNNPWTLVYDGAITENVKGKVNIHPVTYKLNGLDIAANV